VIEGSRISHSIIGTGAQVRKSKITHSLVGDDAVLEGVNGVVTVGDNSEVRISAGG
jgi:ADP-glucose pyrophosphorylase